MTTPSQPDPAAFESRVASRRVDLLERIEQGIPPLEYLPASEGRLIRGRRHQWVAPKKTGKSLGALVHTVDMVLAGATVVIFDRENGADLYARRLEAIIDARELDHGPQDQIRRKLAYYEFPRFRFGDENDLVQLCTAADLVVFDSQRMFLTDLGVGEDSSDDYSLFMAATIDPLFRARIATLVLDNSGHTDPKRGRGSSSKGDLQEILFALETVQDFDLYTTGLLRLEITDSRFGNHGRWELELGGGRFGSWEPADHAARTNTDEARRLDDYKADVSSFLADNQGRYFPRTEIVGAIKKRKAETLKAIEALVQDGYLETDETKAVRHARKFPVPDGSRTVPGTLESDGSRVPTLKGTGNPEPLPGTTTVPDQGTLDAA